MIKQDNASSSVRNLPAIYVLPALLVVGLWSYWTTLAEMAHRWHIDPQYSHGYLVPGFAAWLMWHRRHEFHNRALVPSWWGLPLLVLGIGTRLFSAYYYFEWFDGLSLIPLLLGAALLLTGWQGLVWSWPSILFLGFMVPLPHRIETMMSLPLQEFATATSNFVLQMCGIPSTAEGNIISLTENRKLNVVEACSGLRMLVIFMAISSAVALLSDKPLWERLLIVASGVPIALISNIVRITSTGLLMETVGERLSKFVWHDFAGWLMMPLALGLMWVEMKILSHLLVEPTGRESVSFQAPLMGAIFTPDASPRTPAGGTTSTGRSLPVSSSPSTSGRGYRPQH